jgi:hypothetical protein
MRIYLDPQSVRFLSDLYAAVIIPSLGRAHTEPVAVQGRVPSNTHLWWPQDWLELATDTWCNQDMEVADE